MEANKENYQMASKIIEVFKASNCTVKQAQEILSFVEKTIVQTSTVQFGGRFPYD